LRVSGHESKLRLVSDSNAHCFQPLQCSEDGSRRRHIDGKGAPACRAHLLRAKNEFVGRKLHTPACTPEAPRTIITVLATPSHEPHG
jgi:hypothetical protein